MIEYLTEYLGELILLIGIGILRLLGKNETAEKLEKKRLKKKKRLSKKCEKESKKLAKDYNALKELEEK